MADVYLIMKPYKKRITLIFILSLFATATIIIVFPGNNEKNIKHQTDIENMIFDTGIEEGRRFSEIYCSSCHIYPEPELLDKQTWLTQALPAMGPKMGIYEHNGMEYPVDTNPYVPEKTYPSEPLLTREEWHKIAAFYEDAAPEKLTREAEAPVIVQDSLFFKPHVPQYRTDSPPTATVARFDPGNRLIYLSDIDGTNLLIFNHHLELDNTLFLSSTISDVRMVNDLSIAGKRELILTYLGSMYPSDAPDGFIIKTEYDSDTGNSRGGSIETIIENLVRPVETLSADLDQDGLEDLLIHEFGHRTGSLFWLKNTGNGYHPDKRVLADAPGCIQSHITDYTNNGLPDIVTLCTQADQTIYLFENQGKGEFIRKTLIQFPVTAGSSSFELHDFNGNGHLDILYTSGDNADFSITFKPYHGVYIYLNDGNNGFTKEWFYPINGAYNAKARDFDGSGYLDIAVISFFGDYANRPEEGFLFFRNNGSEKLSFTPYHHPAASSGRWLTMDVADWTGNGYEDILLANYSLGPDINEEQAVAAEIFTRGPLFLLLENRSAH